MMDSGNQINEGYLDFYNTYRGMVDAALARPAQGVIRAYWSRIEDRIRVQVTLTNRTAATLSASQNKAAVHAIAYEDTKVHTTSHYARAVAAADIASLGPGATASYVLETRNLDEGADWSKLHVVVLADYKPGGLGGPYDIVQATRAQRAGQLYLPWVMRP